MNLDEVQLEEEVSNLSEIGKIEFDKLYYKSIDIAVQELNTLVFIKKLKYKKSSSKKDLLSIRRGILLVAIIMIGLEFFYHNLFSNTLYFLLGLVYLIHSFLNSLVLFPKLDIEIEKSELELMKLDTLSIPILKLNKSDFFNAEATFLNYLDVSSSADYHSIQTMIDEKEELRIKNIILRIVKSKLQ